MATTLINKSKIFRKLIDLDEATKTALMHQAAEHGMNLKKYIETLLVRISEAEEDKILSEFAQERDGRLTGKEKEDFEQYLDSLR